jgi:fluoroacetyl-CoA thioesterase
MKETLRPGATKTKRLAVDKDRTIGFMGEEGRVYATPTMVRDIEHTCRDLLMEHSDPDEDSVGVEVSIKHLAATLMDMTVEITATVKEVDRRKVVFEITGRDEVDQIVSGTHARFVVEVAQRKERLKAKAEKWAAVKKA